MIYLQDAYTVHKGQIKFNPSAKRSALTPIFSFNF